MYTLARQQVPQIKGGGREPPSAIPIARPFGGRRRLRYFRRAFLFPLVLALRLDLPRVFAFAFAFERAMAIANYLLSSVSMPARHSDRIVSGNDAPQATLPGKRRALLTRK